ncbi:MAG: hypothetical protein HY735_25850 [Verrucomicrobia bacterium]|nr:hypothetical protein [Verrucomicrobiota bacterium]
MAQDLTTAQAGGSSGSDLFKSAQQTGGGRAFQSIAQSIAISIQDAVDNLRNVETISTTATGVAMAQLLATKDEKYVMVIQQAQTIMTNAINNYKAVGDAAGSVLGQFTSKMGGA